MELNYKVGPLTDAIKQAYHRLLPHHEELVAQGKLEWKYFDGPLGPALISTAESDGKVLGMIGSIPLELRLFETTATAIQAIDGVVDPETRGKGCFTRMARDLHEAAEGQGFKAIFGFPNQNAAPTWFGKLGWTRLGRAPFLFKPLRAGYFLRRFLPRSIDFPLSFARRSKADIRRIDRFDARTDQLWDRFAGSRICAVERSHKYLNWRLLDCPSASYDCFGLFDGGQMRSFVATHTTNKHGGRLGYIMEAIGDGTLPELLKDMVARLKADEVEAILAWCFPSSPNHAAYRKSGFVPLPATFAPEINFGGRAFKREAEPMQNASDWYLSYLDSDSV